MLEADAQTASWEVAHKVADSAKNVDFMLVCATGIVNQLQIAVGSNVPIRKSTIQDEPKFGL